MNQRLSTGTRVKTQGNVGFSSNPPIQGKYRSRPSTSGGQVKVQTKARHVSAASECRASVERRVRGNHSHVACEPFSSASAESVPTTQPLDRHVHWGQHRAASTPFRSSQGYPGTGNSQGMRKGDPSGSASPSMHRRIRNPPFHTKASVPLAKPAAATPGRLSERYKILEALLAHSGARESRVRYPRSFGGHDSSLLFTLRLATGI